MNEITIENKVYHDSEFRESGFNVTDFPWLDVAPGDYNVELIARCFGNGKLRGSITIFCKRVDNGELFRCTLWRKSNDSQLFFGIRDIDNGSTLRITCCKSKSSGRTYVANLVAL